MSRFEFLNKLTRKKQIIIETASDSLLRVLDWKDLIFFGVGDIIGAGIFVLTGVAARLKAGPAIVVSFILCSIACLLSALCYAELSGKIPAAGSAYSYTYVAMGELAAFLVGWSLMLEYGFGTSSVARGWASYLNELFLAIGIEMPTYLFEIELAGFFKVDVIAFAIVIVLTLYVMLGVKSSSVANMVVTGLSMLVIFFVVVFGATQVDITNWTDDFAPFGATGIAEGAAIAFFAYVGFDAVANFGEEVKNPNRDVPLGIFGSLAICTVLYISVSLVVTGMVPYYILDLNAPLANAFAMKGAPWASILISLGAFFALTTTMLVSIIGQVRILFSIARDGLLPQFLSRIYKRTGEPIIAQAVCGLVSSILALFIPFDILTELVSSGTLYAFTSVNIAVLLLRNQNGSTRLLYVLTCLFIISVAAVSLMIRFFVDKYIVAATLIAPALTGGSIIVFFIKYVQEKPVGNYFKTPLVPLVPLLGIAFNVYLMSALSIVTWMSFFVWFAIGLIIYFTFSIRHSQLSTVQHSIPLEEKEELDDVDMDNTLPENKDFNVESVSSSSSSED